MTKPAQLIDSYGRIMRDLRVSVTDRCNFRCLYCLPETEEAANFYRLTKTKGATPVPSASKPIQHSWLPKSKLLSFEEIDRVVEAATGLGVEKIRITGGEPLLRRDLDILIQKLARHQAIKDLAMTTNGHAFASKAFRLRDAGLSRVSFSLDSLDPDNFEKMTGKRALNQVLDSIEAAIDCGYSPIKINAVVIRDMNDHELVHLVEFALNKGIQMRFIEFMPLDSGKKWMRDRVVPGREILDRLSDTFKLTPAVEVNTATTSKNWRINDSEVRMGIIAPVTEPFCGFCNRLRLTADGMVRTCLFSLNEHDLRPVLRQDGSREALESRLQEIVLGKEAGHKIGQKEFKQPARTMSCIGG